MLSVPEKILLLVLIAATAYFFMVRAKYLISLLKLGQPDNRSDNPNERLSFVLGKVLKQRCVLDNVTSKDYAGIGHMLLFYGFSFFVISYGFHIAEGMYEKLSPALFGTVFNNVFFFLLDVAGLVVIASLIWAAVRRYIIRPERLEPTMEAGIIIIVVFSLMILNYCVEGFRLLAEEEPFANSVFVGKAFAQLFAGMGLQTSAPVLFPLFWWLHLLVVFGFGVYILYSKHLHVLASHPNLYFHSTRPKGTLVPIENMEEAERFGVSHVTHFTWKHLLDLYACTECGWCTANCPAATSGKPLRPKDVIHNLKVHLLDTGKKMVAHGNGDGQGQEEALPQGPSLIGDVVTQDQIWDCTNCMACMEVCPVAIEHVDKLDDMRRHLVLMESDFPAEVQVVFRNMENNSNPWGMGMATRGDWAEDLGVKLMAEDSEVDLLYYVGCAGSFDDRYKKVSRAMVKILQTAGVNFAILGAEEGCCGDSARRIGNEYLFYTMAAQNIETFKAYNVKKILVTCPHGYNTLKKEYPHYGGDFEVIHHSDFIMNLIRQGRLKLKDGFDLRTTFHDSCFLGRYNGIYDAPRQILASVSKTPLLEMDRRGRTSFCCGAGGGRMWMEELRGEKINEVRTAEALSKNPECIATACPFCMTMFEDGLKAKDAAERVKVIDIAEVVASRLAD